MNDKISNIENILLEYISNSNNNFSPLVICGNEEDLKYSINNVKKIIQESDKSVLYINNFNEINNIDLNKYIFIFENIDKIVNKEQEQHNFFKLFNNLYDNNKFMIIFSNKQPEDLLIEERIITRLNWGKVINLNEK